MNVGRLLRTLTAKQFLEWEAYATLEPFDERRADLRSAHIVQTLMNVNRDSKKHPEPYKLEDCVLKFEIEPMVQQSPATHKTLLMMITEAYTG